MNISKSTINGLLQAADIEGFINLGTPEDEYENEAEIITRCLNEMTSADISNDVVLTVLTEVWKTSFNLDAQDIRARQKDFAMLAQAILASRNSA